MRSTNRTRGVRTLIVYYADTVTMLSTLPQSFRCVNQVSRDFMYRPGFRNKLRDRDFIAIIFKTKNAHDFVFNMKSVFKFKILFTRSDKAKGLHKERTHEGCESCWGSDCKEWFCWWVASCQYLSCCFEFDQATLFPIININMRRLWRYFRLNQFLYWRTAWWFLIFLCRWSVKHFQRSSNSEIQAIWKTCGCHQLSSHSLPSENSWPKHGILAVFRWSGTRINYPSESYIWALAVASEINKTLKMWRTKNLKDSNKKDNGTNFSVY